MRIPNWSYWSVNIFQDLFSLDPVQTKHKLIESQEQVEKLRQELRNARDRERRQKSTVRSLMEDLKRKRMLTVELQQKLDFYSSCLTQVHFSCIAFMTLWYFLPRNFECCLSITLKMEQQSECHVLTELFPAGYGAVWQFSRRHRQPPIDMSSMVLAEGNDNIASSPFEQVTGVVLNHCYLPTSFGTLTENTMWFMQVLFLARSWNNNSAKQ